MKKSSLSMIPTTVRFAVNKKITTLLAACVLILTTVFAFNSCKDDSLDQNLLIGNWKLTSVNGQFKSPCLDENQRYSFTEKELEELGDIQYFSFLDNKTFSWTYIDEDDEEEEEEVYYSETGTWSISGKTLKLEYDEGGREEGKINKLSSTELVIYTQEKGSENDCTYEISGTITYRKVATMPKSEMATAEKKEVQTTDNKVSSTKSLRLRPVKIQ